MTPIVSATTPSITIGTVLDEEHATLVQELREALASASGCEPSPTVPHISLAVVSGVGTAEVDRALTEVAATHAPYVARMRGVAIVRRDGDRPIVYLPVIRSPELDRVHTALVDRLPGAHLDGHYRADRWIPHVTIWSGPVVSASMGVLVDRLASVSWNVPIVHASRFGRVGVELTVGFGSGAVVDPLHPAART